MSKASRRVKKRRVETGAVQVLEEAFHLVRSVDLYYFWIYFCGTIPFAVALLYFVADMSRSYTADRDAAFNAAVVTVTYFWMRFCQARFCLGIRETISPGFISRNKGKKRFQQVMSLFLLHSIQAPLLLIGVFLMIPLGWVIAARENLSALALADTEPARPLRDLLADSYRHSHYQWAQNHGILLVFCFLALFMWINLVGTCVMLANLGKAIFGIESFFTLNPLAAVLNSTFVLGTFLLTYLILSPLMKAAYTLRCFYAESQTTGADLLSRLASAAEKRKNGMAHGAPSLQLVLVALAVSSFSLTHPLQADETPNAEEFRQEIERTLEQKKYQWQLSRRTAGDEIAPDDRSWLSARIQELAESINRVVKSITEWIENSLEEMSKRERGGNSRGASSDTKVFQGLSSTMSIALTVLVIGLILWIVFALYRKHKSTVEVELEEEGLSGPIDLESEDIVATQLPEDEWMRLAREQLGQGDRRLAVRALFLATLSNLGENGVLRIARFKSNRDYRSELERKMRREVDLLEAFGRNTGLFERTWYGLHEVSDEMVEAFLSNHGAIVETVNEKRKLDSNPQLTI